MDFVDNNSLNPPYIKVEESLLQSAASFVKMEIETPPVEELVSVKETWKQGSDIIGSCQHELDNNNGWSEDLKPIKNEHSEGIKPAITNEHVEDIKPIINGVSEDIKPIINGFSEDIKPIINAKCEDIKPIINLIKSEIKAEGFQSFSSPNMKLLPVVKIEPIELPKESKTAIKDTHLDQEIVKIKTKEAEYDPSLQPFVKIKREPMIEKAALDLKQKGSVEYLHTGHTAPITTLSEMCQVNALVDDGCEIKERRDGECFSCNDCGATFKNKYHLRGHLLRKTMEPNFLCGVCGRKFKTKQELKSHCRVHSKVRNIICDLCGKGFWDKYALKSHLCFKKDHKIPCYLCKKMIGSRGFQLHIKRHSEVRPLGCSNCPQTFKCKKSLQSHLLIHTGEKPFKCEICEKTFRQISHLRRHERWHSGVLRYFCKVCNKGFVDSSNLRVHMYVHDKVKKYACEVCGERFAQSPHLIRHKLSMHNDERPLQCNVCDERFKTKDILNLHIMTHWDPKDRPYKCQTCGRTFVQNTHFRKHKCNPFPRK